jgi:hypothetical protein
MLFTRRGVVRTAAAMAPAVWFGAREAMADSDASQISRDAAVALRRLDATDHRAVTRDQKAAGILVSPKIVKAGFIFGGQGGKGVLTEHGHTRGFYSIAAASSLSYTYAMPRRPISTLARINVPLGHRVPLPSFPRAQTVSTCLKLFLNLSDRRRGLIHPEGSVGPGTARGCLHRAAFGGRLPENADDSQNWSA